MEKDTFVPMRLLTSDLDIRYERYRYTHEYPYPRAIFLYSGATGLMEDDLTEFAVNPSKSEWKDVVATGFTEAGNAAPSGVRELIRKYYETLR